MAKAIVVTDEQGTGMDRFKAQPEKLMSFLKDVRSEMRKVITPSRDEVQSTTIIVIVTVFIFAGYFALVDFFVGNGVDKLFQYLAKH